MADVKELAAWFVEFAKRHAKRDESTAFADEVLKKMFDLVEAAGFEARAVTVEALMVPVYDWQDRDYVGKRPLNDACPFAVVDEEGGHHEVATSWLNQLWKLANPIEFYHKKDSTVLVEEVQREIVRSVPLKPIPIGPDGEFLLEYPPAYPGFFTDHTNDEKVASGCVGVHKYCNGCVNRKCISKKFDAIVCRECGLRTPFPREVKTYGDLRAAMAVLKHNKWRWPEDYRWQKAA